MTRFITTLSFLILFFQTNYITAQNITIEDILEIVNDNSSDQLLYTVYVENTTFDTEAYEKYSAELIYASDSLYAVDYKDSKEVTEVLDANSHESGLEILKPYVRKECVNFISNDKNIVEIKEEVIRGMSAYEIIVKIKDTSGVQVYEDESGNKLTQNIKIYDNWYLYQISEDGILLKYESHALSNFEGAQKQHMIIKFQIDIDE